jgi:hypothetical protein
MHRLQMSRASGQCSTAKHAPTLPLRSTRMRSSFLCNAVQLGTVNGDVYSKLQGKKVLQQCSTWLQTYGENRHYFKLYHATL